MELSSQAGVSSQCGMDQGQGWGLGPALLVLPHAGTEL